jgi:hypothetical protein
MKTEDFENEFDDSSSSVVVGIRTIPSLKMELNDEARQRGITLSENCVLHLANRHNIRLELEDLKLCVAEQKAEIERLTSSNANALNQVNDTSKKSEQLAKQLELMQAQPGILNDERLLYLFDKLKGKKDVVENAFGENFEIVYETPEKVLIALIYSSKLNQ